ncbi:TlpA family protein disulfide reductase [bacterium]|nr:TlpA family protein disulfide reductase [bacterium]
MKRTAFLALALLIVALMQPAYAADAPSFELEDLEGDEYTLEGLLEGNKLLLIDFWQVGCKPCNKLMPHLQEYYDKYKEQGVEFVIVSRDTSLTLAQVEPYFRSNKFTFTILLDTDLEMSSDYGVKVAPATFIIEPGGEMIYQHYGYKPGEEEDIPQVIEAYLAGEEIELSEDGEIEQVEGGEEPEG